MLYDFYDDQYVTHSKKGTICWKADTCIDFTFIPVALTVAVQREGDGPWAHDTVVECGTRGHDRSYKIHMTKTDCIWTRTAHHIKQPQYLQSSAYDMK